MKLTLKANKSALAEVSSGDNQRPLPYNDVVYERFLKSEYIENVTWLSGLLVNSYISW
jgi:hypothetical protein